MIVFVILAVLLVVVMVVLHDERREHREADAFAVEVVSVRQAMPDRLVRAKRLKSLCERIISTDSPVPMVGKPDVVYEDDRGVLIPVEVKKHGRQRHYWSDIVQLSAYRTILSNNGYKVSDTGYVCLKKEGSGGRDRYIEVKLMEDQAIARLWKRYRGLAKREVEPVCAEYAKSGRHCGPVCKFLNRKQEVRSGLNKP